MKNQKYNVHCHLDQAFGDVKYAKCNCKVGQGGCCKYVAVLLYLSTGLLQFEPSVCSRRCNMYTIAAKVDHTKSEIGLLLKAISIIADIFIFIPHLQRLLSIFERMSIFFNRKMNVISAPNEIFFQLCCKLRRDNPSTDLSKKIPCNYCNLVVISIFVRVLKNSLRTANFSYHVVGKGLFDWLNTVKLNDFRMPQQPVTI